MAETYRAGNRLNEPLAGATTAELLDELAVRGDLDDDEDGIVLLTRVEALRGDLTPEVLDARRPDFRPDLGGEG